MKRFILIFICIWVRESFAQGLEVRSNGYGISFLSYRNNVLLNQQQKIGASYYNEGAKVIRKGGKAEAIWPYIAILQQNSKGDGWKYIYDFFEVSCQYRQLKDTLFITLVLTNTSKTDTLAGFNILPVHLQFPQRPKGFQQFVPYYHYNLDGPTVITADFGTGKLVLTNEDTDNSVFVGLLDANTQEGKLYKVWVSAIPFNGMVTNGIPNLEKKLAPGQSVRYRVALRFYPSGTPDNVVAPTVMASYRAKRKVQFTWKDKRPIGTLFLSSVAKQNVAVNPRGWLPALPPNQAISIRTVEGTRLLRNKILEYAQQSIDILKNMNAQGMITWDIEGQQFPHDISYVGSPDKIQQVAPEMDAIADEYFALFRKAGFKVGICLRPQEFILSKDGTSAVQQHVKDPAAVLIRKIKYARNRWGCTLFYIDSNVDDRGILMDATVFQQVHNAVPDVLLIPEHQNIKYFEFTAPYEEMRMGTTELDQIVSATYPTTFLTLNTADGFFDATGNRKVSDELLKKSLQQGNIFLFRAWFDDQPGNGIIKKLYSEVYNRSGK
jgi:hypothetical protein